jgi:hypothetical protein
MSVYVKDPDADIDYTVDWGDGYLNESSPAETITLSTWHVAASGSPALTIDFETNTDTTATVWVSGGEVSKLYRIVNTITTTEGRTDERSIILRVENR